MTTYTLFWDGQPIAQDTSAGHLHDIGKPGDILLATDPGDPPYLFSWRSGEEDGPCWVGLPIDAYTPEMQLNLLLQQGTLPTGKALLARRIVPIT